jgi:hypothetical protein
MKKMSFPKFASALSMTLVAAAFSACGAENLNADLGTDDGAPAEEQPELGEFGQSLVSCTNVDGTNSVMAALAVAAATELKRWQPSKDFVVSSTSGQSEASPGPQQAIKLTATGKARCADGRCWNTQGLLDLQYDQANNKIKLPGNVTLSPAALRSRLVAKLREQQTCEARPANGGSGNCPVEEHQLTFQRSQAGGCDTNFFFQATQPNGQPLKFPGQLKNKLLWVDNTNPYVAFASSGSVVSIDPTYGLDDDGTTSTGACTAACVKLSLSSQAGQCCSCNGTTKSFARSPWSAVTFLCQ